MTAARQIQLLDLRPQHATLREEVLAAIVRIVDSQKFILGEEVQKLEEEVAAYSASRFGVGCASGSDALYLALVAAGVGPGDKVLTSPYTFFATVGAIVCAGATPVFADVERDTFNIDPTRAEEALERYPGVRAIIPVHLFGACADMDPLVAAASRKSAVVIEDAAQAIGAEYKNRRAGSMGHVGCFSFFPSKNLGAYGDAGMLTTSDLGLAERLALLRVHGSKNKYVHEWVGVNSRLDALQAAVLRVKLRYLDQWTAGRQHNAALYRRLLAEMNVPVRLPAAASHTTRHIHNQFVVCIPRRDELRGYLSEHGIGSEVYYPVPMHLQPCFSHLGYKAGDFPIAEELAQTSLALPVYPELPEDDIAYVCETIRSFYKR